MMSFLSRLSARALPNPSHRSVALPKGLATRRPTPLYRETEPTEDEPEVAPWRARSSHTLRRRNGPVGDEEAMARAPSDEEGPQDDEAMRRATLRRQAEGNPEEEAAPLPPGEGKDEELAPLRRAAAPRDRDDEPPLQPTRLIRRAEEVPLDDGERPLRQPFEADLSPDAMSAHPDLAYEEEPPALQALRRDVVPPRPARPEQTRAAALPPAPRDTEGWSRDLTVGAGAGPELGFGTDYRAVPSVVSASSHASERPQVVIEQLDVLIHEPPLDAARGEMQHDYGRSLRARYLRRL
jgi:hypothetical protein